MVSIPESRIAAEQFDLYVEELREFARSYGMKVGSPEDLRALRAALDGPGTFRAECASMMRSVVYRERGQAPTEALLTLIATAWGGEGVSAVAPSLQEPIGRIVIFLSGVMRIQRDSPPAVPTYGMQVEVVEPVAEDEPLPRRSLGIYASAVETSEAGSRDGKAVPYAVAVGEVREANLELGRAFEQVPMVDRGATQADSSASLRNDKERERAASSTIFGVGNSIEVHDKARDRATPSTRLREALEALEAESPEVRLYLQLLKQREGDRMGQPRAIELDERPRELTRPRVSNEVAAKDDPWGPNSELHHELRRFAAQKAAKAAAYRRAKAALPLRVKLLFAAEAAMFRVAGPDNFVRRYLAGRLALRGPDRLIG